MLETLLYQRTEMGRAEIKNKSRGLTQSERQTLIMVDGATSYGGLAQRLTRLNGPRLQQILLKLEQQGLIAELLLASDVEVVENFDSGEIERFLHQDALDPVTVLSFQPDQDFELTLPGLGVANTLPTLHMSSWVVQPPAKSPAPPESEPVTASVDFYLPLTEAATAPSIDPPSCSPSPPMPVAAPKSCAPHFKSVKASANERKPSWEYWFVGLGLLFIAFSLLARYLR